MDRVIASMDEPSKAWMRLEPADSPGSILHFGPAMQLRNDWGLWESDTPLSQWFATHDIHHGDDKSAAIFKAVWSRLSGRPFDITAESEAFRQHWASHGVNPDGSPLPHQPPPPAPRESPGRPSHWGQT